MLHVYGANFRTVFVLPTVFFAIQYFLVVSVNHPLEIADFDGNHTKKIHLKSFLLFLAIYLESTMKI